MKVIRFLIFAIVFNVSFLLNAQQDIQFIDIYYANKKKERIKEFKPKQEIFLVIKSLHGIGREVTVEMNEDDPEVIYNKRFLTEGDVFYWVLKKNKQLIKFTVFDPKNKKHQKLKAKSEIEKAK